ncbi:hypothetical protein B0H13DRAFT_2377743 [Mycena leptocephala]|nr:hypothetical protein B0H13DRAFT_2377743 [Mycena leptocephala]
MPSVAPTGLPPLCPPRRERNGEPIRIGILGAGIAGLYAALLIDYLGPECGITYDILEANPDRTGGRLYTHRFSDSPNDYFAADARGDFDPFGTKVDGLTDTINNLVGHKIDPFKHMLTEDFQKGWEALMSVDQWSMRDWLALPVDDSQQAYPEPLIKYLETFTSSTGLFDCALSETILDAMDFDYQPTPEWFTVQGGGDVISNAVIDRLTQPIQRGRRVTAVAPIFEAESTRPTTLKVNYLRKRPHRLRIRARYLHMPFGCLRMVDTSALEFPWELQTAHERSITTLPSRSPSNSKHGGGRNSPAPGRRHRNDRSADAHGRCHAHRRVRQGHDSASEQVLLECIKRDLADMHDIKDMSVLDHVDHKIVNWYGDEYSVVRAFALFGPGQFSSMYCHVTQPILGMFHFAGEATSVHHAWVVGSLNSAYRSLIHEGNLAMIDKLTSPDCPFPRPNEIDCILTMVQVAIGQSHQLSQSTAEPVTPVIQQGTWSSPLR